MCALGYTLQLYFDFSGYSDMAIGLGLMLGLKFPQNFHSPYKSYSITDFWRRWHITLSSWLRDYLYISLGGNRKGPVRTYINLLLTMLLGGLWHGAAWTYVIWGGLHGSALAIERKLGWDKKSNSSLSHFSRQALTFFVVVIGWVIFRSETIDLMSTWLTKMFSFTGPLSYKHFMTRTRDRYAAACVIGFFIAFTRKNTTELDELNDGEGVNTKTWAIFLAVIFFMSILFLGNESPFLYFQF